MQTGAEAVELEPMEPVPVADNDAREERVAEAAVATKRY